MNNNQPDIIYEDNDIIVCVKPAGVFSQTKSITQQDMVSILKNYLQNSGQDSYVGILQRLDCPVYGLMAFAKNSKAAAALSAQINDKVMKKTYMAVVSGKTKEEDVLEDYLQKDSKTNISKPVASDTKGAKRAILSYERVGQKGDLSMLRISLKTGRHHQIRAQLSSRGMYILGDVKYGAQPAGGRAIALAAYRLDFVHPKTNKEMSFEIPLDEIEFFKDFY